MVTRDDEPPKEDPAIAAEAAFYEGLEDKCKELNIAVPDARLMEWFWKQVGDAYLKGYNAAVDAIMTERDYRRS